MNNLPKKFNLAGSRASEKLDGIQAIWDGIKLVTRAGNTLHAPIDFLSAMPNGSTIGELWIARGTFQQLQSIVTRKQPDSRWSKVKFIPFDSMPQTPIESTEHLEKLYSDVISAGGEGLVITTADGTQYKLKPVDDNDGRLIGYVDGRGKYEGLVNGLILETRDGIQVKISAGLTADMRNNPPAIGSIIRFKFNGLTKKGMPRHARFDAIRAETNLNF